MVNGRDGLTEVSPVVRARPSQLHVFFLPNQVVLRGLSLWKGICHPHLGALALCQ